MSAREALAALDALAGALRHAPSLPPTSRCRELADAGALPDAALAPPSGDVVEALRAELWRACEHGDAGSLPRGTLRHAPLALWNGERQAAGFPGLLDRFLLEAGDRARWLGPLIEAWLHDFGPDHVRLSETGRTIVERIASAAHPRLSAWREAQQEFKLFDVEDGPRNIARALLRGPAEVGIVLRRAGMDDPIRAVGGYFRACVRALLKALPDAMRRPDADAAWVRAVEVLQVFRDACDGKGKPFSEPALRFADMAGETARACLTPWLDGAAPSMPRDPVKAFLVAMIGDPRVQPMKWSGAGDGATALMRRWLAEATLDAFFALIQQRGNDQQWQFRRKFWLACLGRRRDAEVWVILDPALEDWAKTLPALKGSFGSMNGAGVQSQAVLLMRIGDLVLSEWSNVGPVRAWDRRDPRCPKLYRDHYPAADLRADGLDFPDVGGKGGSSDGKGLWHRKPHKYHWQQCAAALLLDKAGLRLTQADYA